MEMGYRDEIWGWGREMGMRYGNGVWRWDMEMGSGDGI